jgi:hypothetical protein
MQSKYLDSRRLEHADQDPGPHWNWTRQRGIMEGTEGSEVLPSPLSSWLRAITIRSTMSDVSCESFPPWVRWVRCWQSVTLLLFFFFGPGLVLSLSSLARDHKVGIGEAINHSLQYADVFEINCFVACCSHVVIPVRLGATVVGGAESCQ